MITLYDAERCPYCARVRIVLAEKGVEHEVVAIDLSNRPDWLYEKNVLGKVPVLEEDTFVLPESHLIMEYLDERHPDPPLLPTDPAARAAVRLAIDRFDHSLGDAYYAYRRREDGAGERLAHCLGFMERGAASWPFDYGLADIAYVPWLIRLRDQLGFDLSPFPALLGWIDELAGRPAVAAEIAVVASLSR